MVNGQSKRIIILSGRLTGAAVGLLLNLDKERAKVCLSIFVSVILCNVM